MSELNWELKRIVSLPSGYQEKAAQFGLTILDDQTNLPESLVHQFRNKGVWALQNPLPIAKAISNNQPFSVLVGMRPPKILHWGHLTLFRELHWLKSIGGRIFLVFADYEADARLGESESNNALESLRLSYRRFTGSDLILQNCVLSDRICFPLRELQDQVNQYLVLRSVLRLYGWNDQVSLSKLQISSITAASFLLPSLINPDLPTLVLSDINQITHSEATKIVARKMRFKFPSFSYRLLLPSLLGPDTRMSTRKPLSYISLDDDNSEVRSKLLHCFTGGRATIEEQRREGGRPFRCSFFSTVSVVLNDQESGEMYRSCISGRNTCRECKTQWIPRVIPE